MKLLLCLFLSTFAGSMATADVLEDAARNHMNTIHKEDMQKAQGSRAQKQTRNASAARSKAAQNDASRGQSTARPVTNVTAVKSGKIQAKEAVVKKQVIQQKVATNAATKH